MMQHRLLGMSAIRPLLKMQFSSWMRNTGWVLSSKVPARRQRALRVIPSSLHVLCGLGEGSQLHPLRCPVGDILGGENIGPVYHFLETELSFLLGYNLLPSVTLQDQRLSFLDRCLLQPGRGLGLMDGSLSHTGYPLWLSQWLQLIKVCP